MSPKNPYNLPPLDQIIVPKRGELVKVIETDEDAIACYRKYSPQLIAQELPITGRVMLIGGFHSIVIDGISVTQEIIEDLASKVNIEIAGWSLETSLTRIECDYQVSDKTLGPNNESRTKISIYNQSTEQK